MANTAKLLEIYMGSDQKPTFKVRDTQPYSDPPDDIPEPPYPRGSMLPSEPTFLGWGIDLEGSGKPSSSSVELWDPSTDGVRRMHIGV